MTLVMARPAVTAEWVCTRCGTTNRKLVPAGATEAVDRCLSCHLRHAITRGTRPVRWNAALTAGAPRGARHPGPPRQGGTGGG